MKFKNLQDIQKYVEKVTPHVIMSEPVRDELARRMRRSVYTRVYKVFEPETYPRRKDKGGLSDVNNMKFTNWYVDNRIAHIFFENLTPAQDTFLPIYGMSIDSMDGYVITDMIVEGYSGVSVSETIGDWYWPYGLWVLPRDFVGHTAADIKKNPKRFLDAIKQAYERAGFDVGL